MPVTNRMKEYDPDVPVDRITVSLDADLARRIRLQAELEGRTVSAWISDAAAAALGRQGLAAVIADYEAEFGAFTDEEMQAAKEVARMVSALVIDAGSPHRPRTGRPRRCGADCVGPRSVTGATVVVPAGVSPRSGGTVPGRCGSCGRCADGRDARSTELVARLAGALCAPGRARRCDRRQRSPWWLPPFRLGPSPWPRRTASDIARPARAHLGADHVGSDLA